MKALRRARHSLGAWRDCDVLIALLERKARRIRRADEKQACEMIRDLARKKRRGRMRRARRKLASRKLVALVLHAFRIQTKRLRYRVELARDLGSNAAQEALDSLKTIQDELGRWHDSTELVMLAADALADPEFSGTASANGGSCFAKNRSQPRAPNRARASAARVHARGP
jgi:CHAD domain-containing protein